MRTLIKDNLLCIPVSIIDDTKLNFGNKFLLNAIINLHNINGVCNKSNKYFSDGFNLTTSAVSKKIQQLKSLGYIETELIYYNDLCIERIITPLKHI